MTGYYREFLLPKEDERLMRLLRRVRRRKWMEN